MSLTLFIIRAGGIMSIQYQKDPSMVGRKIADEFILVPIKQNAGDIQCMYSLNSVGARIWELIDGHATVDEITSVIVQEYEVETPQAKTDVIEFLEQMKEVGAVVEKSNSVK
jgi:hypothetical protein